MTKAEIAFYLNTARSELSPAQRAVQTMVYKALNRDMPAEVKPPKVKVDRKAAAAKARATMLANILASAAELADDEANEGAETEHEDANADNRNEQFLRFAAEMKLKREAEKTEDVNA